MCPMPELMNRVDRSSRKTSLRHALKVTYKARPIRKDLYASSYRL